MSSWRIKTGPQSEEVRFSIWSGDVTLTDCDNVNKSLYRERQDKNNKSKNLQQGKSYMFYPNAHVILLYLYCTILCIVFEKWIISCHISKQVCHAAAAVKSLQWCLTVCDPIYGSPPGSSIPGILPARTLERVAISFSNAWKWKVKVKSLSGVWLPVTPWTAAYQAPPSMGFSRQEYGSGCHIVISNCSPPMWSGNP